MATSVRERQPRNWLWWLVAGLVVALLVIGAYTLATRAQRADLPGPADLSVEVPRPPAPPTLPETPNLPPAPLPAPR
jgi:hypothetical protein